MIRTNFAMEHQTCGGLKTYVGDTRMSMTCSCGAEIIRETRNVAAAEGVMGL